jgi:hypothetical protein
VQGCIGSCCAVGSRPVAERRDRSASSASCSCSDVGDETGGQGAPHPRAGRRRLRSVLSMGPWRARCVFAREQYTEVLVVSFPRSSPTAQRLPLPPLAPCAGARGLPPIGIHVLRHSAAAGMMQARATPKRVQTVLGHSSGGFTLTVYGYIFDADLDDLAVRLENLGRIQTGCRSSA